MNVLISTPKVFSRLSTSPCKKQSMQIWRPPLRSNEQATWEAGRRAWLIVLTLAFVSLIVALDATILVTALPVRLEAVTWH